MPDRPAVPAPGADPVYDPRSDVLLLVEAYYGYVKPETPVVARAAARLNDWLQGGAS